MEYLKIPSHRASWLNILDRNHTRPQIQLLLGVGSPINQQGGPVCPAGRLESVRDFNKINVFLQNDLSSLNQNFPGKTNPSEHLSNSIVHAPCRDKLLFVFQCFHSLLQNLWPYYSGCLCCYQVTQQIEHPQTLKCNSSHRSTSRKGEGGKFHMSPIS